MTEKQHDRRANPDPCSTAAFPCRLLEYIAPELLLCWLSLSHQVLGWRLRRLCRLRFGEEVLLRYVKISSNALYGVMSCLLVRTPFYLVVNVLEEAAL